LSRDIRKLYRTKLEERLPENLKIIIGEKEVEYEKYMSLRYGENPHQPAAFYRPKNTALTVGNIEIIKTGKGGLSQTNVEDVNNSMRIVSYFPEPACSVMKHLNPSGVAVARRSDEPLTEVYRRARDSDSLASFGGVVGFNTKVDEDTAKEILTTYVEAVVAPDFDDGTSEIFSKRKNLRILKICNIYDQSRYIGDDPTPLQFSMQSDGSVILSHPLLTRIKYAEDLNIVTERPPTTDEFKDLIFSWYVCMNVRSNGVVLSKDRATIGIGTGQQDRVTAVKIALEKAVERGHKKKVKGAVLASDGFFPFRDSIDLLAEYKVKACIQPGGSIKDKEVIQACNEHNISMTFTKERCFRHF
jgi:phosphoribosylaminoimidazolecarboxamide formyltransferase/IMP cyclohydrolase